MEKLLTIIIPSYNMEKYLPKCLGSLIVDDADLLQKLDVIVVNDGSKDRTSEIAHDFERRYPGIVRVIDKPNGHYGSCINAALPLAQGKYVRILDADDYVKVDRFPHFLDDLRRVSAASSPDAIVTDYDIVDGNGIITSNIRFSALQSGDVSQVDAKSFPFAYFQNHNLTYRTALFDGLNYQQTEGVPYTDTEWYVIPMTRVSQIAYFAYPVVNYLVGRTGQTADRRYFHDHFDLMRRLVIGILSRLAELLPVSSHGGREFAFRRIRAVATLMYHESIFEFGRAGLSPVALDEFDRELKVVSPEVHQSLDEITCHPRFKFHYVREWRRRNSSATLKFFLFRSYMTWLAPLHAKLSFR